MGGVYAPCLEKSTSPVSPHVDGWRWEHVRDLNVPAWRKWVNRYSAGNIPEAAADFLASATGGLFTSKPGSTATPLAFGVRLLKSGRLLLAAFCRG
jgi:hypothetical protein